MRLLVLIYATSHLLNHSAIANDTVQLNMDTAKTFAVRNNHQIQALRSKIEAREHGVSIRRSTYLPTVDLRGGISADMEDGETYSSPVSYIHSKFNIFNGGRDHIAIDQMLEELNHDRLILRKKEFALSLSVEKYFYEFIYISKTIKIRQEALDFNKQHKKMVKRKLVSGLVSDADAMEFAVRKTLLQSEHVSRELDLEQVRIHFKRILGQKIGTKIRPLGELADYTIEHDLMHYLNLLKTENLKIQIAAHQVGLAKLKSANSRTNWLPSLDLEAQYGFVPMSTKLNRYHNSTTGRFLLVANFNLFNGMRDHHRTSMLDGMVNASKSELKDQITQSVSQVEVLYRKIKSLEMKRELQKNNISHTKKYYQAVVNEYKRGSKNSSDLATAIDQHMHALDNREKLKLEFLEAKLQLEEILGTSVQTKLIKANKKD
jgi:outer membrane protein